MVISSLRPETLIFEGFLSYLSHPALFFPCNVFFCYDFYGEFDAASWESHGISLTGAVVCLGRCWFACECVVMHRSQHTWPQPDLKSNSSPTNLTHLHTLSHINPVAQLIGDEGRYEFNPLLF